MIVTSVGPLAVFYRMLAPRWAHQPLSGAGAAVIGGRLNRRGLAALYLSGAPETAIAEFRQTDSLLRPGTVASYEVTVDSIVDFRGGFSSDRWDIAWNDFWCDWRALLLLDDVEPPSWLLGDMALAAGHRGILFPSQAQAGGTNLVLFVDALATDDAVRVHDPDHALPRDQSSWTQTDR